MSNSTTEPTVTVSAEALREVLQALTGPDHFIRELQTRTNLHNKGLTEKEDPITQLIREYSEQAS